MGYRMAKNLREKLPKTDTLLINDVNKDAVGKFVEELSGFTVHATGSPREIAERAVRTEMFPLGILLLYDANFCPIHD